MVQTASLSGKQGDMAAGTQYSLAGSNGHWFFMLNDWLLPAVEQSMHL
jgi:hypothetical protein